MRLPWEKVNLEVQDAEGITVLHLGGRLDFGLEAKQILHEPVQQALAANRKKILVNVKSRITDNIWVGAIVTAALSTITQGGTFKVVVTKDDRKFLETCRLNTIFGVYDNEQEALASFQ